MGNRDNLNKQQRSAVEAKNQNILLSAGAGTGKTEVLGQRVTYLMEKENANLANFLILTFTRDASFNMSARIKNLIIKNKLGEDISKGLAYDPNLLTAVDSAEISTLDSFCQRFVRQYSYLLDIKEDFSIISENEVTAFITQKIKESLNEKLENQDPILTRFFKEYCFKDDREFVNLILQIIKAEKNIISKDYRKKYIDQLKTENKYFDFFVNESTNNFKEKCNLIIKRIEDLESNIENKRNIMEPKVEKFFDLLIDSKQKMKSILQLNSFTQNDFSYLTDKTFISRKPKNCMDDLSIYQKEIKDLKNLLLNNDKNILISDNFVDKEYFKNNLNLFFELVNFIFNFVDDLNNEVKIFKNKINSYEFSDLSFFTIKILEDNQDIQNIVKNKYKYIMVDECQDNNDIQEKLLNLIQNDNLFYVGDIKQSIYAFRNSNVQLFKNRYELYQQNKNNVNKGKLISMNENYRSTKVVLKLVNHIFKQIMTEQSSDVNYKNKSHQLVPKHSGYDIHKEKLPNKNNIYFYKSDLKKEDSLVYEIYKIIKDIQTRVDKEEIIDSFYKDEKGDIQCNIRKVRYKDFAIITVNKKNINLIMKYLLDAGIPVINKANIEISGKDLFRILLNIFGLIYYIDKKDINNDEYKHCFYSVSRSLIFEDADDKIYNNLKQDNLTQTDIYKIINDVLNDDSLISFSDCFNEVCFKFNVVGKLYKSSDPNNSLIVYNYFLNQIKGLVSRGYSLQTGYEFLKNLFENTETKIEIPIITNETDAVTIINVHKSKGLEYNIVYYCDFSSRIINNNDSLKMVSGFTTENFKNMYSCINLPMTFSDYYKNYYNSKTSPIYKDKTYSHNIMSDFCKSKVLKEKIRLLYVALTRAKYQINIFLKVSKNDYENIRDKKSNFKDTINFNSFVDLLSYINYDGFAEVNFDDFAEENILNDKKDKNKVNRTSKKIKYKFVDYELKARKFGTNASKGGIIPVFEKTVKFGTKIHNLLSYIDFNNPDFSIIKDSKIKKKIESFFNSKIMQQYKGSNFFPEYEYFDPEISNYNRIDLLIVNKDEAIIIDYKLKNIDNGEYEKQLKKYKDNIIKIYPDRKVSCYLYSLFDEEFKQVN